MDLTQFCVTLTLCVNICCYVNCRSDPSGSGPCIKADQDTSSRGGTGDTSKGDREGQAIEGGECTEEEERRRISSGEDMILVLYSRMSDFSSSLLYLYGKN